MWKPGTSGANATPRVACKPDAVACDHPYNGECPDLCPLENGIGGTGSLNVKNGNDVYHVGQIDTL